MKIHTVKTFIYSAILAGSTVLNSGCDLSYGNSKGLYRYISEKGFTQSQTDSIINVTKRKHPHKEAAVMQSTLDSIAYRDLFNQTNLAKDSAAIAEFNKIASKSKFENKISLHDDAPYKSKQTFIETLTKDKEAKSVIDSLKAKFPKNKFINKTLPNDVQNFQHYIDKYFYGKFFRKHGLVNEEFKTQFDNITKKISPDYN